MNYHFGFASDAGIMRKNNQDSISFKAAVYQEEPIYYLALCDGMGGFSKGELASSEVLRSFNHWFEYRLPRMLEQGFSAALLRDKWIRLAQRKNDEIRQYSEEQNLRMGTTLTAALFYREEIYTLHVGDSRLYEIGEYGILQLTHDQTVTQREVDAGLLTLEQAENDRRQHFLLQCIGASKTLMPEFTISVLHPGSSYLICSDGFRHKLSAQELERRFAPEQCDEDWKIENALHDAIELNKQRGERDNITAGVLYL